MTAADFAALRQTLEQIAAYLETAPGTAVIEAIEYEVSHAGARYPYAVGMLVGICRGQASAIRSLIADRLADEESE